MASGWPRGTISTTILAVLGQMSSISPLARGNRAAADTALDAAVAELEHALAPAVYSVDGRSLEVVVGDLLRERRLVIAVAESCTGGLLASRLTDVPGSSEYVERGVVCYSNRSKVELLGVPEALILEHGASAKPWHGRCGGHWCPRRGWRRDWSDGIAGPTGGRPKNRGDRLPSPSPSSATPRSDVSVRRRARDGEILKQSSRDEHAPPDVAEPDGRF